MHNSSINEQTVHHSVFRSEPLRGLYIFTLKDFWDRYSIFKKPQSADFYTIVLTKNGKVNYTFNGESANTTQHSLLFTPPETKTQFTPSTCEGYIICFLEDFYTQEYNIIQLLTIFNPFPRQEVGTGSQMLLGSTLFGDIWEMVGIMWRKMHKHPHLIPPNAFSSILNSIFAIVGGILEQNHQSNHSETRILLEKLSTLLDAHYFNEHGSQFYANAIGISMDKLNQVVKIHYGYSLKKLITQKVMLEARKLLLNTNFQIAEIGYKLNFTDNSYFNKVFTKYHNLSPGKFRELHKKHH